MPQNSTWLLWLLAAFTLLSGCREPPTTEGNAAQARLLLNHRIGFVLRSNRFVYGLDGTTHNGRMARDAPRLAWRLTQAAEPNLDAELAEVFTLVSLAKHAPDSRALLTEGDYVGLRLDGQHQRTLPPDDALLGLVKAASLKGLLVLDLDWFFSNDNVGCYATFRILDADGKTLLHGKPGSHQDGHEGYVKVSDRLLGAMTAGMAKSDIPDEQVVAASRSVGSQVGKSVALRIRQGL